MKKSKYTDSQIIAILNEADRVIYQKHLEGFNYEEIAEQLNMTEGQVRGRVFRSKDIIRKKKDVILKMLNGSK